MNRYLSDPSEFSAYLQSQSSAKLDILQRVQQALVGRPLSYSECLRWARLFFEDLYVHRTLQLLHNLPLDKVGEDGTPFW